MSALVIAEHNQQQLHPATLNTVTAAQQLGVPVTVAVIGYQCQAVANAAALITGINKVIYVDDSRYQQQLAEPVADLVVKLSETFNYVLTPATTTGKNFLPRVAALRDVAQLSDVIAIVNADTFIRPIYAGNALATVQSLDPVKIISIRTTGFTKAAVGTQAVAIETVAAVNSVVCSEFVNAALTQSTRPELSSARLIVSGGRGLQNKENFILIEQLADRIGAAVGASRAAVDAGFVPNDYQVGQTGKIVAPDLYLAIGISGAIQHLAGMKESKVIVAINKDEEAPIFQIADYGLVGDLFEIIPQLMEKLS